MSEMCAFFIPHAFVKPTAVFIIPAAFCFIAIGCATQSLHIKIPKAEIERNLAKTFPITETYAGGAAVTLKDPELGLRAKEDRMRIRMSVSVAPAKLGFLELTRGVLAIKTGISFDKKSGQFLLEHSTVDSLEFDLPVHPDVKAEIAEIVKKIIGEKIEGMPVYRLDPQSVTTRIARLFIRKIRIESTGVTVVLGF
jgi:hypothetical protein